jgi:hypothetical protein
MTIRMKPSLNVCAKTVTQYKTYTNIKLIQQHHPKSNSLFSNIVTDRF